MQNVTIDVVVALQYGTAFNSGPEFIEILKHIM